MFQREVHDDDLTYRINGVAIGVHKRLGNDQPEATYRDLLAKGLRREGFDCLVEHEVTVDMYDVDVGTRRVDLLVEGEVVVELKALKQTTPDHMTQLASNVYAAGASRGLLLNFGLPSIDITRFATKEWIDAHT